MADMFEDEAEAEPTITINDYLNAVEEEELEADLVLGGDDGKECTYNKGYMKRQAIFSCLTCTPDGNAGFCTACCLACHEDHEMVELWTKRNFRCDCGNSKFGAFVCKLLANKDVENSENAYNHNFKGRYCTCDLVYPDPNAEEQVEMIQCCICEDWFHEEHIGLQLPNEIPRDDEGEPLYEDFICPGCSVHCSFLTHYPQTIALPGPVKDKPLDSGKGKAVLDEAPCENIGNGNNSIGSSANGGNSDNMTVDSVNAGGANKSVECVIGIDLIESSPPNIEENGKAMFMTKNWRDAMCRCKKCSEFYVEKGIRFLVDKEDTIAEYETMAKQKRDENILKQEGDQDDFLNNLGHVEKIEILRGIGDIKNEFAAFVENSDPTKAITPEDVQQVFDNLMKKRKRQQ